MNAAQMHIRKSKKCNCTVYNTFLGLGKVKKKAYLRNANGPRAPEPMYPQATTSSRLAEFC